MTRRTSYSVILAALLSIAGCGGPTIIPASGGSAPCAVHHIAMRLDTVPVGYGLVIHEPAFINAEREGFPNARDHAWGGCVVEEDAPRLAAVWYCGECRRAHEAWTREHPERR